MTEPVTIPPFLAAMRADLETGMLQKLNLSHEFNASITVDAEAAGALLGLLRGLWAAFECGMLQADEAVVDDMMSAMQDELDKVKGVK